MKNRISAKIIVALIIIAILFISFWVTGLFSKGLITLEGSLANRSSNFQDANLSLNKLPSEVKSEIRHYEWKYNLTLDKWEFDQINKSEIKLYAHDIHDQSAVADLQGKQIGNYTIHIIHDIEFEAIRADVEQQLVELRKNPDYQIAWIGMITDPYDDPPGHYAELWVYQSTHENKKLDNTVILGWKIQVYPVAPLPTNTSNSSKK
jgi:hypothetical protein